MKRYGLGDLTPYTFTPDPSKIATKVTPVATPAPQPSFLDRLFNTGGKILDFGNKAAGTVNSVNNAINPYLNQNTRIVPPPYVYNAGGNTGSGGSNPTPKPGMSAGAKVAIGVAAAALVGTVVYLATGKKKK